MSIQAEPPRRTITRSRRPVIVNAYDTESRPYPLPSFKRFSLGAVIAGVLVALIVMVAMNVLGLAIGATTLNAMIDFEADPAFDPADGIIVWMAITNLVALFAGGWVAGRLAGVPDETDGVLHGLVTWSLVMLISLVLFTTAAGRIISGAADAVGTGLNTINAGVETVVPVAVEALERQGVTLESIRAEARSLAADTGDPNLQPGAITAQQDEAGQIIQDTAEDIARDPSSAASRIETAVDRLLALDAPSEVDRQDVVNVLVANTNMTQAEAYETVNAWETRFSEVELDVQQTINTVSENVTEAIALAAGVVFMAMMIGAMAAGVGGWLGAPTLSELEALYTHEEELVEAYEA